MDQEYLKYLINGIERAKEIPFHMTNKQSAVQAFPCLECEFPNIQMVEFKDDTWFVVSPRAKIALKHNLQTMVKIRDQEIKELQEVIKQLAEG